MGIALVTGATSGLGEEVCWQLAAARHDLVVVARSQENLELLAHQLRSVANIRVEVLRADLANPADLAKIGVRLAQQRRPVGLLVNNAGFGLGQAFVDGELDRELYALDVMVKAVLVLSQAAAKSMRVRGRGAILNVSSMTAGTAMGTYAAHKTWVRAFSESLSAELAGSGVTVTAVCPGLVRTGFHAAAGFDTSAWPASAWIPVELVVTEALTAVRRGQVLVTPSVRYRILSAFIRLAPRWLVRCVAGKRAGSRALIRNNRPDG